MKKQLLFHVYNDTNLVILDAPHSSFTLKNPAATFLIKTMYKTIDKIKGFI